MGMGVGNISRVTLEGKTRSEVGILLIAWQPRRPIACAPTVVLPYGVQFLSTKYLRRNIVHHPRTLPGGRGLGHSCACDSAGPLLPVATSQACFNNPDAER